VKPRTRLRRKLVWGTANGIGITSKEDSSVVENYIVLNEVPDRIKISSRLLFFKLLFSRSSIELSFKSFRKLYYNLLIHCLPYIRSVKLAFCILFYS